MRLALRTRPDKYFVHYNLGMASPSKPLAKKKKSREPAERNKKAVRANAASSQLELLQAKNLAAEDWLLQGFSTRKGGVSNAYGAGTLNLGFTEDDSRANSEENRRRFLSRLAPRVNFPAALVTLRQVHSDRIHHIARVDHESLTGDGMVTNLPGAILAIQTADCLPVLLADPMHKAVGAFHAGWRGSLARIVQKGVGDMQRRFGSNPRDLIAAIGPGIHACCYRVGDELRDQFEAQFSYATELFHQVSDSNPIHRKYPLLFLSARAPGHGDLGPELHLNLVEANRRQLIEAGVRDKNIEVSPLCTSCHLDLLFSYRGEHGKTGRMLAAIGVRP